MDLRLEVSRRGEWSVVEVGGEIDVATAPRLREQLIALVNDQRYHIVVSLEAVDFIDSTGLGVLISGLKRVRTHGGEFALVCTEPRILKVFEITGLLAVFNVCASIDDAIASGSEAEPATGTQAAPAADETAP